MIERKHPIRHRRLFVTASLLLSAFLVCSVYGPALVEQLPPVPALALSALLAPLRIPMLFSPLFAGIGWFSALFALALLLAAGAIWLAKPAPALRLTLLGAILLLAAAPFLLPRLYEPYIHYVETGEGVELHWPTQPTGPFASAFKSAQRVHEKFGCTYHLLGWSEDEALYYTSTCGNQLWQFEPAQGGRARPIVAAPPELQASFVQDAGNTLTYVPQPAGFQPHVYNHVLTYDSAISPSGKWQAAAIKNYYGPRDVVILSRWH